MDNQNNRNNKNNPKNNRQGWGVILVTTLLTAFLVMGLFSLMQGSDPQEISYDKFLKMVDEKKVEKVTIDSAKIYITLTDEARKEAIKKNQEENTATAELLEQIEEKTAGGEREPDYYTGAVKDDTLSQRLYDAGVEYAVRGRSGRSCSRIFGSRSSDNDIYGISGITFDDSEFI